MSDTATTVPGAALQAAEAIASSGAELAWKRSVLNARVLQLELGAGVITIHQDHTRWHHRYTLYLYTVGGAKEFDHMSMSGRDSLLGRIADAAERRVSERATVAVRPSVDGIMRELGELG